MESSRKGAMMDENATPELWKWVVGYEGLYLVSNLGRVFSTPKTTHCGHVMKQNTNWAGYKTVCLSKEGVKKFFSVHRLVSIAFIDNVKNKKEVNHINGIRSDNRLSNLEWVTRSENEKHAFSNLGKKPNAPWKDKPRKFARVLNDSQIESIMEDCRSSRTIAQVYDVSKTTILNIKNGKIYKEKTNVD